MTNQLHRCVAQAVRNEEHKARQGKAACQQLPQSVIHLQKCPLFSLHTPLPERAGNKYTLSLNGAGHKPRLDLSFTQADFGPTMLFQQGMTPATRVLRLRNNDTLPISIDPQWTNTEEWQVRLAPQACSLRTAPAQALRQTRTPVAHPSQHRDQ